MLLKLVELMRPWWSQVVTNQLPSLTSIIINRTQQNTTQQSCQNWNFQGDTSFYDKRLIDVTDADVTDGGGDVEFNQ